MLSAAFQSLQSPEAMASENHPDRVAGRVIAVVSVIPRLANLPQTEPARRLLHRIIAAAAGPFSIAPLSQTLQFAVRHRLQSPVGDHSGQPGPGERTDALIPPHDRRMGVPILQIL